MSEFSFAEGIAYNAGTEVARLDRPVIEFGSSGIPRHNSTIISGKAKRILFMYDYCDNVDVNIVFKSPEIELELFCCRIDPKTDKFIAKETADKKLGRIERCTTQP